MNAKTIIGWAAVAFVVWWVIEQPTAAAHLVHNIGTFLSTTASGFSSFFAGNTSTGSKHEPVMPIWEALLIGGGGVALLILIIFLAGKLLDARAARKSKKI